MAQDYKKIIENMRKQPKGNFGMQQPQFKEKDKKKGE